MKGSERMIQVIDLKKDYGNEGALRGIHLKIKQGEFVSIMGKSGCGKSTLLHCLSGILKPSSGQVTFIDHSLFNLSGDKRAALRRHSMGFVFQFFNLIPEMTVRENILLPIKINRMHTDEAHYDMLVTHLGIKEFSDRLPSTLSGGQQQRVAIARALIHRPSVVFADEPTGNLDEESAQEVMDLLLSLQQSLQLTMVLVTHDKEVAQCADRTILMRNGLIVSV